MKIKKWNLIQKRYPVIPENRWFEFQPKSIQGLLPEPLKKTGDYKRAECLLSWYMRTYKKKLKIGSLEKGGFLPTPSSSKSSFFICGTKTNEGISWRWMLLQKIKVYVEMPCVLWIFIRPVPRLVYWWSYILFLSKTVSDSSISKQFIKITVMKIAMFTL